MPDISTWEQISLNTWPTLHAILYDGWILRYSEGYTKRSNSVNPVYTGTLDVGQKIRYCEEFFRSRGCLVIFKMTEAVHPHDLDALLRSEGYRKDSPTSVQTIDLTSRTVEASQGIQIEDAFSEAWLADFCRLSGLDDWNKNIFRRMLTGHSMPAAYLRLFRGQQCVGCGLSVQQDDYIGFFDIVVDEKERRRGRGSEIMNALSLWGKRRGAKTGYLQVECDNEPALRLYKKLGFTEAYQYWYRIKDETP